jgi:hypothetical protein
MVSLKSKAALEARKKLFEKRMDDPNYHFHNTQERHAQAKANFDEDKDDKRKRVA